MHRDPPRSDEPSDAGRVATLVGLLFGLAGMGSAGVAVALPALAADLGLSIGGRAWVISVYALTLAVATAVYGEVTDRPVSRAQASSVVARALSTMVDAGAVTLPDPVTLY